VSRRIYISKVPPAATETSLFAKFSKFGTVVSVNLIVEHSSGRSLGVAFVEMATAVDAERVIAMLHDDEYDGRLVTVRTARPYRRAPQSQNRPPLKPTLH
jgi:RNA recognition motif-containing protein